MTLNRGESAMANDATPMQTAMEGAGFYNRHSSAQAAGIDQMLALLEEAANKVRIGDEALTIADYGASQGRNSMTPMRLAIQTVRARFGVEKPVVVFHTDLPSNDFTSLFTGLHDDPNSYLAGSKGIFPVAVGRSFFDAILPPGQVHLGWNSWAVHWLSQKSADAPDHVSPTLSAVPAVRSTASQQSALDWKRFLESRSSELRNGGKLLCLIIVAPQPADTDLLWTHLWDSLVEIGKENLLTKEELVRITLPIWYRSLDELRAPFGKAGHFAGLRLEHTAATHAPDPFWGAFQQNGDSNQFGRAWANTMRAISAPAILSIIGQDRTALLDEICSRYAARIAAAPKRFDWNLAAVVIGKID
jgi:SAM dependent carboxyl methyltransferase